MDSDLIRREIEVTAARVDDELRMLEVRAGKAARSAALSLVLLTTAVILSVAAGVWRYRRRDLR